MFAMAANCLSSLMATFLSKLLWMLIAMEVDWLDEFLLIEVAKLTKN